jgi:hypothetical protein
MNGSRDNVTSCFNCGTLNVTGVRSCINCHAPYYYNCPYCHSWVDSSFSNCPSCAQKLNWPKEVYYTGDTSSLSQSTSSAVIILLVSIVLLSIVAINLISSNSNPVDAVSHTSDVAITSSLPANEMKTATQPQIKVYTPIIAAPSATQADSSTTYTDADVNYTDSYNSYQTSDVIPLYPASTAGEDTYVPKRCSYLDTLYPNWGRCSGGSCRSTCQQ